MNLKVDFSSRSNGRALLRPLSERTGLRLKMRRVVRGGGEKEEKEEKLTSCSMRSVTRN